MEEFKKKDKNTNFLCKTFGRIRIQKIGFLNRVISVISVVLRETTLTISDSTDEPVSIESERVRVVSLYTTEMSEIIR